MHLSDLHASALLHRPELDAWVDSVNREAPDLVLMTGDLVMPFSEAEHGYLLDALSRLRSPAISCAGNHDLPVLSRLAAGLKEVNIPLLVDQSTVITTPDGKKVEIVGVNFHWRHAKVQLAASLRAVGPKPAGAYSILLAHDPRLGGWVPEGRFDLILSGHTHGGQVAANMLGIAWSVLRPLGVRDQGWWQGQGAKHFVHRGNWFTGLPPRMGVGAEVAVMAPPEFTKE